MKRILFAIFASTLVATLAISLLIFVPALYNDHKDDLGIGIAIIMAYGISIFIGVLVIGLPVHLILAHFSIKSIAPYIFVGFIVPVIIIFVLQPYGADTLYTLIKQGAISGLLGVICASVFWCIATKPNTALKSDLGDATRPSAS